jgi:hypothetical protein
VPRLLARAAPVRMLATTGWSYKAFMVAAAAALKHALASVTLRPANEWVTVPSKPFAPERLQLSNYSMG